MTFGSPNAPERSPSTLLPLPTTVFDFPFAEAPERLGHEK